jgi:O-antigen ligase
MLPISPKAATWRAALPWAKLLPLGVLGAALVAGWLTSRLGILIPALLLGVPVVATFLVLVFRRPRLGFLVYIGYCFLVMTFNRHLPGAPLGLGMDGLLVLVWLAVVFFQAGPQRWTRLRNDLCLLSLVWLVINVLEIANPAGASLAGWFYEMRSTMLYWVLTVPLTYLLLSGRRDLELFLVIVIGISVLGTLYGIKQNVFGVDMMEKRWLDSGASVTHILFGKLRVFSFYSDAAQFGSSQAHVGLICLILAGGPYPWWKRLGLATCAGLLLYGMLISGTRGALFVLVAGGFLYLVLSKQLKVLILGSILASGALFALKFTSIGSGNPSIVRLRSSLNPEDASLQVRLKNQATLRTYLASRPFGGGVGSIGSWGRLYNPGKFLSTIPPDSYFVKVWAEYGIVGFLIWLGLMLYILGKCCGIVWHIRDPKLRQQLLALTAGFAGILLCSYGNEIMNQMPSALILYISWVFVFRGPELDAQALTKAQPAINTIPLRHLPS